jgi:hypothetical protein
MAGAFELLIFIAVKVLWFGLVFLFMCTSARDYSINDRWVV